MLPYWTRARQWAREQTKPYAPWKAVPSVLAVLGQWAFDLHPLMRILAILGSLLGAYILTYVITYLWNLFIKAPVALESEREKEIDARDNEIAQLSAKLSTVHPPRLVEVVRSLLAQSPDTGKILHQLLARGELHYTRIMHAAEAAAGRLRRDTIWDP